MTGIAITAAIENAPGRHRVLLETNGSARELAIAAKPAGGSSANGGELLCLALATCFCNDLYREAVSRGIEVVHVEVEARATFGAAGEPATRLDYRAKVRARAPRDEIASLIRQTDSVAEVHNTLRKGMPVALAAFEAIPEQ